MTLSHRNECVRCILAMIERMHYQAHSFERSAITTAMQFQTIFRRLLVLGSNHVRNSSYEGKLLVDTSRPSMNMHGNAFHPFSERGSLTCSG